MKKEVVFAILFGIIIGSIVTYGIYTANKSLSNKIKGNEKNNTIPIPTSIDEPEVSLTITSPENGLVVSNPDINIEGKSVKNAYITLTTDNEDFIIETDENGFFSQKITLLKGANTIKVTATNINKTSDTKTINLVYSTEVTKNNPTPQNEKAQ